MPLPARRGRWALSGTLQSGWGVDGSETGVHPQGASPDPCTGDLPCPQRGCGVEHGTLKVLSSSAHIGCYDCTILELSVDRLRGLSLSLSLSFWFLGYLTRCCAGPAWFFSDAGSRSPPPLNCFLLLPFSVYPTSCRASHLSHGGKTAL